MGYPLISIDKYQYNEESSLIGKTILKIKKWSELISFIDNVYLKNN